MIYNHPYKVRHPDIIAAREHAHAAFDLLWREGPFTKEEAYHWLASKMGLPSSEAHIGRFNPEQCDKVWLYATNKYMDFRRQMSAEEKKHKKRHEDGTCRCVEYDKWYDSLRSK